MNQIKKNGEMAPTSKLSTLMKDSSSSVESEEEVLNLPTPK